MLNFEKLYSKMNLLQIQLKHEFYRSWDLRCLHADHAWSRLFFHEKKYQSGGLLCRW